MSIARADRWQPTPALVRCLALVLLTVPVALLWRRPDLLVLVTPMAVVLVWSVVTRPRTVPTRTVALSHAQVREGEQVLAVADVEPVEGAEIVAGALSPAPYVEGVPTVLLDGNIKVEQIDPENLKVIIQSILDGDGVKK